MRPLILACIAILTLASCSTQPKGFVVEGSVKDHAGEYIYFQKYENNTPVTIDSAKIGENGDFSIATVLVEPSFYQLTISPKNAIVLIGENQKSVDLRSKTGFLSDADILGDEDSKLLNDFNRQFLIYLSKRDSIAQLVNMGVSQQEVMKQMQDFSGEVVSFITGFAENNLSSPAVLTILSKLDPVQNIELYKKAEAELSKTTFSSSPFFQAMQRQIASAEMKQAEMEAQQALKAQRDEMLKVGNPAPEITLPNPLGETKKLSDFKGKVVLIDFWASWCKPCRIENPNVVKMYNKYKNRGFEIFSVSLDRNKTAWQNAIREDNLTWTHVSDLKFWQSEAAQTYGVEGIPFTVLVDADGKILAKGLRGAQLEQKLKEILG